MLKLWSNIRHRYTYKTTHPKEAAVLVLFDESFQRILFTLRSSGVSHANEISFPGGVRDSNDKSLADTCKRETLEETGIDNFTLIAEMDSLPNKTALIRVTPFIGISHSEFGPDFHPGNKEVEKVFSLPIQNFQSPIGHRSLLQTSRRSPIYESHLPTKVWGLTALILEDFFENHWKK